VRFFRRRSIPTAPVPDVQPLADHGLIFTFGDQIDAELSRRIVRLAGEIANRLLPGVIDVVPSYTTLLLIIDHGVADRDALRATVLGAWVMVAARDAGGASAREVVIPVVYGGEHGPDLDDVAQVTGMSPEEVIDRHRNGTYQVGAIGFAPGFAFLIGLSPELAVPRRATPRTLVPAGSVGIGGNQTGIYSLPTPGGWSLIGRTQLTMFDPDRDPLSLLQAGDRVRFEQVPAESPTSSTPPVSRKVCDPSFHDAIEVVTPGLQTTIQDLGRQGYGHMGVAPGGAVDRAALVAGNRLLGNRDDAAALEITLVGPMLRFLKPGRISLTGGELGAALNGQWMPVGAARVVGPGDELRFGPHHFTSGARAYLCATGGIDVPERMGSRSTDLNARFGGFQGRALLAGDRLRTGDSLRLATEVTGKIASITNVFRVVEGPHRKRFGDDAWEAFLNQDFTVSSSSNRMGIRLDGPRLVPEGGADIISEGMVTGAIQVTGEGQPIVMLPARATIGGYPKIAVVIAADLDALGQLRPGDRIRFEVVSLGI
jgi:KipI family sensor histidine kinase inhibitor